MRKLQSRDFNQIDSETRQQEVTNVSSCCIDMGSPSAGIIFKFPETFHSSWFLRAQKNDNPLRFFFWVCRPSGHAQAERAAHKSQRPAAEGVRAARLWKSFGFDGIHRNHWFSIYSLNGN